ncbi:RNA polymerase sigma-70 factor (ECF subfamily) [Algoriphagus ratkowskyi]|uniref:RNA polymerase sigma-70 factor (ECF subfamily) n=1 Tax=Algoriphagus ratkowskyi TaxID=57028 RepID=A0A2W7RGL4_9BACT|nr:sigma-70 family RNA polymerase sigma factor [Algoriphagus ratkowskyi]PZX59311.1 RNA polymerase sigma-70 factor (ECF subfamily) [Algoriphagus ratkowskyi]TXD77420.1 sigma-70 family RNA polymerase sigma factor [Algoriphagus ratkowskyi]
MKGEVEDAMWVEDLRSGSEEAFTFLYTKYSKKIYHTSRKMKLDHEDAEGVVQETFIKIWKNRERLDPSLSFNAYLLAILKSLVIRLVQQNARKSLQKTELMSTGSDAHNSTEDDFIYAEMLEASLKEVNNLPPRQRQIFLLKRVELLSLDEIADQLHISKKTVKNQLVEASKYLKSKISERDIIPIVILWLSTMGEL